MWYSALEHTLCCIWLLNIRLLKPIFIFSGRNRITSTFQYGKQLSTFTYSVACWPLAAGLTQFSDQILKKYRRLHRIVGWIYAVDILIINFPAAMVMAYYANGLLPSKIAFTLLDCLWFWFTLKAVMAARNKDFKQHKRFMIRSFALTFSAITLRSWKIILAGVFHPDPLTLYMIDAWMGFVPNLLFAEWLIWKANKKLLPLKAHIEI